MKTFSLLCCFSSEESVLPPTPEKEDAKLSDFELTLRSLPQSSSVLEERQNGVNWPDSSETEGLQELAEGKRTHRYANGSVYEGEWLNGLCSGQGKVRVPGQFIYFGNWLCGFPSGHGVLELASGARFAGNWQRRSYVGAEELLAEPPSCFREWLHALNDGFVWMWYTVRSAGKKEEEEEIYTRIPKKVSQRKVAGVRHMLLLIQSSLESPSAQREKTSDDGARIVRTRLGPNLYEGMIVRGEPDGVGKLTFGSNCWYEGEFLHGKMHGVGVHHWPSKEATGQWNQGLLDGVGEVHDASGKREVLWVRGKVVNHKS